MNDKSSILEIDFLNSQSNFFKFIGIVFILKLFYIQFIPITPQEAYYWYYSKNPDLSYFDHPPMAAYSIMLGTYIFGENVFGVKFMAVVWYILTNLLLYKTARRYSENFIADKNDNALAFLTVIIYNLTLFAHIYSITIVPDTPLMFFWLVVIYSIQERFITGKKSWWIIAGIGLGLGLISKYPAIVIAGSIFFFLLFSKKYRNELITPYPYLAVIIAFILFSPVIYWNAERGWASFLFQSAERAQGVKSIKIKYISQLIASQLLILTPLLFFFLFKSFKKIILNWKKYESLQFYFWTSFVIIIGFTFVSLTSLVKMNWLLPGFIPLMLIVSSLYFKEFLHPTKWVKTGIITSIILVFVGHSVMVIPNIPLGNGNTWSGWEDASKHIYEIQKEYGGEKKCFVFSNGYKSASLLKFYLPGQKNTYAENIYGKRALQFDYWGIPDSLIGMDALYVRSNRTEYRKDLEEIKKYFDSLNEVKVFDYKFINGKSARKIICYYAKNYKGPNK